MFADAGLPYPQFTAPAVAIVVAGVALSWCIGFLTRLFAAVFLPVLIGFLILASKTAPAAQLEAVWLYLLISITLVLFGSGAISIDKLFRLGADFGSRSKRRSR